MDWSHLGRDRVFNAADARGAGLDAAALRTMVRRGTVRRLHRGWFTVAEPTDRVDLHLLRTIAAVRHHQGRATASHHSALVVYGLPLVDTDLDVVCLDHLTDRHFRAQGGIRTFPALAPAAAIRRSSVQEPLLVTPVAVAIVQAGCRSGPRAAIAAADAALHRGRTTSQELDAAVTLLRHRRGIGPAAAAISVADGRRESPGESVLALLMHQANIEVVPQWEIPDGPVIWRADFAVRDRPVLIEFDGAVKYDSREDLVREKRREDRLRELGWEFVRFTWPDLARPGLVIERIMDAIARTDRLTDRAGPTRLAG